VPLIRRALVPLFTLALLAVMASNASAVTRSLQSGPFRVAEGAILQYVQSQQLPNGHIRILLQFSGPVQPRPAPSGQVANYVIQFPGATLAPTVPNIIPARQRARRNGRDDDARAAATEQRAWKSDYC
jgi:hypothetical protein